MDELDEVVTLALRHLAEERLVDIINDPKFGASTLADAEAIRRATPNALTGRVARAARTEQREPHAPVGQHG